MKMYFKSSYLHGIVSVLFMFCIIIGVYYLWSPGDQIAGGRYDRRTNGIWIQHGWLGDNYWFESNGRDKSLFRNDIKIQELASLFKNHGVRYVFPHLCPCNPNGKIAMMDSVQTERFLDFFEDFSVVPWIGGVLDLHCFPERPQWRSAFISSVVDLLLSHPRLSGVHLNIEPMPSGNQDFLNLLRGLQKEIPEGKILSIAAYPPPTFWHPFMDVHWDESYYKQIVHHADQIVPMMFDTSIRFSRPYQYLMSCWTSEVLNWSGGTQVLLGIPAYEDVGVGYHFPEVENLKNALMGIHSGLSKHKLLPDNYSGVSIYCEWEMDQQKWDYFKKEFEKQDE